MKPTLFKAQNSNIYIVVNPGAGVTQEKYNDFANYLSSNGLNVLTYDYTDVGIEKKGLKSSTADIIYWAQHDFEEAINFIYNIDTEAKLFILGHSLGGQIIGLSKEALKADGIILVATQTGHHRFWNFPYNIINYFFWYTIVPILIRIYGYLPFKTLMNLENMPKKAALQWASWCRSRKYLFDKVPAQQQFFKKIKVPLISISFGNDIFASKKAVNWFTNQFKNVPLLRFHYSSENVKYKHSALFESEHFSTLANDLVDLISDLYPESKKEQDNIKLYSEFSR